MKFEPKTNMSIQEFSGLDRLGCFLSNWFLIAMAPLWCPITFWIFVFTEHKLTSLTGKTRVLNGL